MKRLIEQFDRAYVINLHNRPDRRREVTREFDNIGIKIPCERVQFYTAARANTKGDFPSLGARGAFTSHRNVLELAVKDKLHNVLIFEDDVAFRGVGKDCIAQIITQLSREEWDVVHFGYSLLSDQYLVGPLMPWTHETRGTHFYAVNGRFMSRMLQYMRDSESRPGKDPERGPTSADGIYNRVRLANLDVRVLLAVPSLARQRSSRTDLQPLAIYDRVSFLEPYIRAARKVKHGLLMALDGLALRRQIKK